MLHVPMPPAAAATFSPTGGRPSSSALTKLIEQELRDILLCSVKTNETCSGAHRLPAHCAAEERGVSSEFLWEGVCLCGPGQQGAGVSLAVRDTGYIYMDSNSLNTDLIR